jgi:hypothetical protein
MIISFNQKHLYFRATQLINMKHLIVISALCLLSMSFKAQNVAINTDGSSAHSSSILDVKSNNKGILLPRMSSAERSAISNPEKGLLVFDNDKNAFLYFDGMQWRSLMAGNNSESLAQEHVTPANQSSYMLGYEISGDGDYVAVSSVYNNSSNDFAGAVHIFHKTATGSWVWQTRITAPVPSPYDRFGYATNMSGDYLIVGAPRQKNAGNLTIGYAYIYKRTGENWNLETTLTKSNAQDNDFFGLDVAITTTGPGGIYAAVSAPGVDLPEANAGHISMYRKDAGGWVIAHNITSANFKANDNTGFSIDLEGDLLVAGAPFKDGALNSDAGMVYFFRYSAVAWQQEWSYAGSEANLGLGYSVSISGNKVAAGGPSLLDDQGKVYLYVRSNNAWDSRQLAPPHNAYADGIARFGLAVSIYGDHLLVGAAGSRAVPVSGINIDGEIPGRAYLYAIKQTVSSYNFGLQRTFESSFSYTNDRFANTVLLSNSFYFIGDPSQSKPGGNKEGSFLVGSY